MATVGINQSFNAALHAIKTLAAFDIHIEERLRKYLANQTESVIKKAERMERLGFEAYDSIESKGN